MTAITRGLAAGCTCAVRRPRRPIYISHAHQRRFHLTHHHHFFITHPGLRDAEAFQQEEVRPALGLGPKVPITPERRNQFLERKPTLRARIERQTPWRGERIGAELSNVYTTLSGHVHSFQVGTYAVTISKGPLSPEQCLLVASTLFDNVKVELDPPGLQERFDDVEALAGSSGR